MQDRRGRLRATWIVCVSLLVFAGCGDAAFFESETADEPVVLENPGAEEGVSTSDGATQIDSAALGRNPSGAEVVEGSGSEASASIEMPEGLRAPVEVVEAYRQRQEYDRPLAVARNVIDKTVPHAMYVYVHDGGGTMTSFESLQPGEKKEFMPAPKEDPARFIENKSELLVDRLVDAGVEGEKASRLVEQKANDLFREHGRRVIYVAPNTWTAATGNEPLGAVEAAAQSR